MLSRIFDSLKKVYPRIRGPQRLVPRLLSSDTPGRRITFSSEDIAQFGKGLSPYQGILFRLSNSETSGRRNLSGQTEDADMK